MKIKPDKDKLDQYIYDYGFDKALETFQITESQAENILFGVKEKRREPTPTSTIEEVIEIVQELDPDKTIPLMQVMKKRYHSLRNLYLKGKNLDKINIRSETPEDKFHNALIKVLEDTERFEYEDDETTFNYIKTRLYWQNRKEKRDAQRNKRKRIHLLEEKQMETLLEQLKEKFNDN
ncbi:hypothetical protein [Marinilabilia salmonicolor]|uniref:Uncharacterized protein n=1 Tax=Marinilabilia salmonicolor TaxID=989 RepID=A0A368VC16_9BACT|nr:hypothetical protein [Marinilabilia salmonicolor]RCW38678.1 hypothetical protein DFO77_103148 [Marinilabilia salmonicolor]